jgi:hypothetical protein
METILNAIGCTATSTRRYFTDVLEGKSIVLSNTNKQATAASASSRTKAQLRRRKRVSTSSLKAAGILKPLEMTPRLSDLCRTHQLWRGFVRGVVDSCSNDKQLQARLNAAGLLGARVTVLRTVANQSQTQIREKGSQSHLTGYVCSESKNCLYIAYSPKEQNAYINRPKLGKEVKERGEDEDGEEKEETLRSCKRKRKQMKLDTDNGDDNGNVIQIFRAIRQYCDIAVPLPDQGGDSDGAAGDCALTDITTARRICLLHGAARM